MAGDNRRREGHTGEDHYDCGPLADAIGSTYTTVRNCSKMGTFHCQATCFNTLLSILFIILVLDSKFK